MLSLSIFCILLALWSLLVAIEAIPWPPQRHSAIFDEQYWAAVQRDTDAYLSTHAHASTEVRRNVEAMATAAQQRLEGLAR